MIKRRWFLWPRRRTGVMRYCGLQYEVTAGKCGAGVGGRGANTSFLKRYGRLKRRASTSPPNEVCSSRYVIKTFKTLQRPRRAWQWTNTKIYSLISDHPSLIERNLALLVCIDNETTPVGQTGHRRIARDFAIILSLIISTLCCFIKY